MDMSAQRSVLVVEDNDDLRNLCVFLLEVEGYRAIGVEDGLQALRFLETEPEVACVVVLDLNMPRLDGAGLLQLKARNPEVAGIPVIVVSATTEAAGTLNTPDVKAVLSKPTAVPDLIREVNHWALLSDCSAAHISTNVAPVDQTAVRGSECRRGRRAASRWQATRASRRRPAARPGHAF